jgi:uncharacterized protein (TIGR03083 family)
MQELTFQHVLDAIKREYQSIVRDFESHPSSYAEQDSYCANWKNYQVVSHLGSGAELFQKSLETSLDGKEAVTADTRQAVWGHFDGLAPQAVYPEFRDRMDKLVGYLEELPESKQNEIVPTFAGEMPLPKALLTRLNEVSLHSWDILVTQNPNLGLPDESAALLLPLVVERLPHRAKRDGLDELQGRPIGFDITGAGARQFSLHPGTEQASVEDGLSSNRLFTVKTSAEAFQRLVAGRQPIQDAISSGKAEVTGATESVQTLNKIFPGY